jgi:hypothetical protein
MLNWYIQVTSSEIHAVMTWHYKKRESSRLYIFRRLLRKPRHVQVGKPYIVMIL